MGSGMQLTREKNIKKSSQPKLFTIWARANSFRKAVAMAIPVNTQAMAFINGPLLSLKSTSVANVAIIEVMDHAGRRVC